MIDPKHLDDLARKLTGQLPAGLQVMKDDFERNLRAGLSAALERMDLVTRDEFEVQHRVLLRTREQLQALEARVAGLERQAGIGAPGGEGDHPAP